MHGEETIPYAFAVGSADHEVEARFVAALCQHSPDFQDEHRYRRVRNWAEVRELLLPSRPQAQGTEPVAAVSEG